MGIDSAAAGDGDGSNPPWAGDRQGIREGMVERQIDPNYCRDRESREGDDPPLVAERFLRLADVGHGADAAVAQIGDLVARHLGKVVAEERLEGHGG